MPAETPHVSDPSGWNDDRVKVERYDTIRAHLPVFDAVTTPTTMGAMPEAFRTFPGTIRSGHPLVSVCANGRVAREITVARRLASTSICVCASPAYVRRHGAPKVPRDLIRHACLGYAYSGTGDKWTFEGKDGVSEVRVRTESRANNGDLLREMAIHGQGIALLPSFIVADDLKARRLVALLPGFVGPKAGIFAIYPSRKYLSAKVRTLVDFLAAHFARRHFEKAWVLFR